MNKVDHYVVVIHGGTEISTLGPRPTDAERDKLAKETFHDKDFNSDFSNIFWLNVAEDRSINVGTYTSEELEDADEEEIGGSD